MIFALYKTSSPTFINYVAYIPTLLIFYPFVLCRFARKKQPSESLLLSASQLAKLLSASQLAKLLRRRPLSVSQPRRRRLQSASQPSARPLQRRRSSVRLQQSARPLQSARRFAASVSSVTCLPTGRRAKILSRDQHPAKRGVF